MTRLGTLRSVRAASVLFWCVAMLFARGAQAQSADHRRVAVAILGGTDAVVGGSFNEGATTNGHFGTNDVLAHSFRDIFRPPVRIGGEVSTAISPRAEVFVRFTHTSASAGDPVAFGQSTDLGGRSFPPRMASFSGYSASAFEFGGRRSIAQTTHVRAFVGGSGGIVLVDAISIDECCDFAGANSRLYASTRTPTVAARAGVDVRLADRVSIGVESGFQYLFGLNADMSDLVVGFIGTDTFPGRRWSVPLTGVLRLAF